MSDPDAKRWLADDPTFLASLGELDRDLPGISAPEGPPPAPAPPALPPLEPRPAASAVRPPARGAARTLDPARLLNTPALAPPPAVERPLNSPAPPLAFTRPAAAAPAETGARRPLLDLFPPSALQPEGPLLPALGTAVGPQLPPRPRPRPTQEPDTPSQLDALTYETFYGLREKPFSLSTDPKFLYQSTEHERVSREILGAIRKRSGPVVLTAPVGFGKTTLCRSLVQEIDRRTVTSLVLDPPLSFDHLLQTMLVDFGVVSRADLDGVSAITRDVLTGTLSSFLESLVPLQASAVVILDEAQNLPVPLLADLAALLSAAGGAAGVLQIVLAGQPALRARLKDPSLRLLDASLSRRTVLGPLAAEEVSPYVMHRLSMAGSNTRIQFDDAACALLFEVSGGVPRVINLLCDHALTRGQQASAAVIDDAFVAVAAAELDLESPAGARPGLLTMLGLAAAFALLVLAGAAAAVWVSRDAVARTIQQWENVPVPPGGPIRRLPVPLTPIPPPSEAL